MSGSKRDLAALPRGAAFFFIGGVFRAFVCVRALRGVNFSILFVASSACMRWVAPATGSLSAQQDVDPG